MEHLNVLATIITAVIVALGSVLTTILAQKQISKKTSSDDKNSVTGRYAEFSDKLTERLDRLEYNTLEYQRYIHELQFSYIRVIERELREARPDVVLPDWPNPPQLR